MQVHNSQKGGTAMVNITPKQEKLVSQLRTRDPVLVVLWDEVRGVASVVRGKLQPASEKKGEEGAEFMTEKTLRRFLQEYGALFGPSDLPPAALKTLRQKKDNLGWTHSILQHMIQRGSKEKKETIEVYGAKLAAHFDVQGTLVEVQSSLWRDIRVDAEVRVTLEELRELQSKRLAGIQGFVELQERLEKTEKYFPLTDRPRLVVYPWKGGFPLAWATYGYGAYEEDREGRPTGVTKIMFGQLFVDATTGNQILFAPTLQDAETPDTGSGLGVTPLGGTTTRTLNIVRVDASNTYRLKDTTHNRNIVTFDPACSTSYNYDDEIEPAIKNGTLPVSEDTDGDKNWNRLPSTSPPVTRTDGQQPEVDAHHFVRQQYEWYNALAGGRDGWDDGLYLNPPVPPQTINVLAHCYPPWVGLDCTTVNACKWSRKSGGVWTFWLAFMDGGGANYDYPAGSHFIVAHEYQHAITDFSFEDAGGNPGLTYGTWLGAVHEGLSDTFGALSSEQWLPCRDISYATPKRVFRNIVYPRDTAAYDPNKLDHFDDRNILTGFYQRGTILAHCAYLIGKGGVHHRTGREPVLIPVYGLGRETVSGMSVLKAARIWYRALSYYFSTHGALTGIPTNDENTFRTLRNGCVSAAIDLYGNGSAEHCNTVLAFYAVGLHPTGQNYGADVTFLSWGVSWDLSRDYVGLTCSDYQSLDLFINNGGISEWNALINVVVGGVPTQYENTIYCRVRNVGDQPANNVQVQFFYAKAGTGGWTWLPVTDKNGAIQNLPIGTLAPGQSNFPDSDQNTPPLSASVKWYIPPLAIGEVVDHFCLKAVVTSSNDVNLYNNDVQSNIAYTAYQPKGLSELTLLVGNPYKEKKIPIELKVKAALPRGWKADIVESFENTWLEPGEGRPFTVAMEMPYGADARLEMPLDGDLQGELYGDVSGPFTGSLTHTVLENQVLQGHLAGSLPHIGAVVGLFTGTINLDTGQVKGKVIGSSPCPKVVERICLGVHACLRPWRRVEISQWHGPDLIGGVTVQVQVPWQKEPCALKLPPTHTKVRKSSI
jgi:Zn-dependent metalloprotease